jgi:probable rRNA maturation factor
MNSIDVSDEQPIPAADHERLRAAVSAVLCGAGLEEAEVSLAIVDDATIHALNRQYLSHDEPTDVLSFLLEREAGRLEGEIVVSRETAAKSAPAYGWRAEDELLLYVIHGALHLVGFDDNTPDAAAEMRRREQHYLEQFGLPARN